MQAADLIGQRFGTITVVEKLGEERRLDHMKGYKTFRTTMGHKIRVKMSAEEIYERDLFHAALILAPFLAGILFGLIWLNGW